MLLWTKQYSWMLLKKNSFSSSWWKNICGCLFSIALKAIFQACHPIFVERVNEVELQSNIQILECFNALMHFFFFPLPCATLSIWSQMKLFICLINFRNLPPRYRFLVFVNELAFRVLGNTLYKTCSFAFS